MTAAAYDEDEDGLEAHEDLGYRGSREAEPDDLDPDEPPSPPAARTGPVQTLTSLPARPAARGDCAWCGAKDVALCQPPSGIARTICAGCQAKDNRDQVERTREAIRSLKAAAATGNTHEERQLVGQLKALVGDFQAEQTVAAIRASMDAPAAGRGGRR